MEALGLLSLSDDLLVHCLAHLTQQERFQHASLVCKRFRALCLAPQLLRSIDFASEDRSTVLARLDALSAFLAAHGRHVERLRIDLVELDCREDAYGRLQQAADLVYTSLCLVACNGDGNCLQELDVVVRGTLVTEPWLAGLTALRRLKLGTCEHKLHVPAGISRLECLAEAEFSGWALEWRAARVLPPSITHLCWSGDVGMHMPSQLSQLTALESLSIAFSLYTTEGMAPLASLTSLRKLRLHNVGDGLPPCLSALVCLKQLAVWNEHRPIDEGLDSVLPSLQQLTCLSIQSRFYHCIPPALAGLSRLQRLCFVGRPSYDADLSLPQGPWLASIRWLGLPGQGLDVPALNILGSAPHLEYLCVYTDMGPLPSLAIPEDHPFWAFVATHPPLRCLGFKMRQADTERFLEHPSNASALAALRRSRPHLRLRYSHFTEQQGTDELLECGTIPH